MKKSILGLAASALFMVGAAQAETNPNDVSATLSITGTVVADITDACTVTLDKNSVVLTSSDVGALINQGDDATSTVKVKLNITGAADCATKVEAGTMAYKFTGASDNADGTVLANTDTSELGAKGVGVGIFTDANKPVKVNSTDYMVATTEGTDIGLQMVKLTGETAQAGNVTSALTIEIVRL
ncbi:fimbrial protein [Cronobacter turicensis]|nr:fimbrial protein [Cronobacter turicensis]EGT4492629.1 type 1 fimbrial protein [Cronobacter turicensis]EKM0439840.1 fimbrial protein [Cronobacter turicensis]ELY4323047.1 fimbrial protein [Cronobacter turicensis]ELY4575330.1 fimbrial protein [Cronobacter turicensis]ELY5827774.1 fimbrial protein [Cronobacter turicensis]